MLMRYLLLSFCLFLGCGKTTHHAYRIGVDATFFPLNLKNQANDVSAFIGDILSNIAKNQHLVLQRIPMNWDNLVEGLHRGKYQGILSPLSPNLINTSRYSFSDPILKTGPVLVVPKTTGEPPTLKSLSGQIIAMGRTTEELDLMQSYPNVDFTFYENPMEALEGVSQGKYSGALIPILLAGAYVKDRPDASLMVASPPLTSQAIRLVTLKNEGDTLLSSFNQGLQTIQKEDSYSALLKKWSLYQ